MLYPSIFYRNLNIRYHVVKVTYICHSGSPSSVSLLGPAFAFVGYRWIKYHRLWGHRMAQFSFCGFE